MSKARLFYYFIRAITYPLGFLPYRAIHFLGNSIGFILFYFLTNYRKRALSNLSLATDLKLSHKQLKKKAINSFQNLAINILEYPKLAREKNFNKIIKCVNPEIAQNIYDQGKGLIFFCGHQANWEVLFLDGNLRMKGIAIGKPIKNKRLYKWVVSIREKTGGRIIIPQKALKEGLRGLKEGKFLGIVGDQGMPESNYSFPFFGRRAWNSTAPALLAYKTNCPIIVATTKRKKGKYFITYSDPIWPNLKSCIDQEVLRLMDSSLSILENSIKSEVGQWLWQHNRWKQQTLTVLNKKYRHDTLAIILPKNVNEKHLSYLKALKLIYPTNFITVFAPRNMPFPLNIEVDEVKYYTKIEEILVKDYRFKMIINFSSSKKVQIKIKKHFKTLSAFEVLSKQDILNIAKKQKKIENISSRNFVDVLICTLCNHSTKLMEKYYATE